MPKLTTKTNTRLKPTLKERAKQLANAARPSPTNAVRQAQARRGRV